MAAVRRRSVECKAVWEFEKVQVTQHKVAKQLFIYLKGASLIFTAFNDERTGTKKRK
jgi:hypothetical protein